MWVNRIGRAIVDGERCSVKVTADVLQTVVHWTSWPWYDYPPCNLTGVPATICYGLWTSCSEEFIFNGDDVTVDIDWALDGPDPPTVTARFEHAGREQPVTLLAWWFRAGAVDCGQGDTEPVTLSSVTAWWPLKSAEACSVPGTDILVSVLTEEFGELEGSFQWASEDVTFAVDTGILLSTPTASPSASPTTPTPPATDAPSPAGTTPTPAGLPEAGGPPGSAFRPNAVVLVVFGAVSAVIVAAAGTMRRA